MKTNNLIEREPYTKLLNKLRDDGRIKIVTGIRRSGKSSLLTLLEQDLIEDGIQSEQIIHLNFELYHLQKWDTDDLYSHLKERIKSLNGKRAYIFLDEIQNIKGWEKVVNSLRIEADCDIYVTGSNAYLLSSDFATLLSGRTATIEILPFSFSEFLKVRNFTFKRNSEYMLPRWQLFDEDGNQYDINLYFNNYLRYGGLPTLTDFDFDEERIMLELNDLQNTIVSRDIIQSRLLSNRRTPTDPVLFNQVFEYLLDNVGNLTSFNKITNTLISNNLLDFSEKKNPSNKTITAYINALCEAYMLYEVRRYDLKGKKYLTRTNKYYSVDTGLKNYILDYPKEDVGYTLENVVYLELRRRGFHINVGKINDQEIDFIAKKGNKKLYIQVTRSLNSDQVMNREISPLRSIKEVGRKIVITGDTNPNIQSVDDIEIIPILDFLLDEDSI